MHIKMVWQSKRLQNLVDPVNLVAGQSLALSHCPEESSARAINPLACLTLTDFHHCTKPKTKLHTIPDTFLTLVLALSKAHCLPQQTGNVARLLTSKEETWPVSRLAAEPTAYPAAGRLFDQ